MQKHTLEHCVTGTKFTSDKRAIYTHKERGKETYTLESTEVVWGVDGRETGGVVKGSADGRGQWGRRAGAGKVASVMGECAGAQNDGI